MSVALSDLNAIEARVVSEIIRSQSLAGAIQAGVKAEHFRDTEIREIYKFIERHWYHPETRNHTPLIADIQTRWPNFIMTDPGYGDCGNMVTLGRSLRVRSLGSDIQSLASFISEMADMDEEPENILRILKARLSAVDFRFGNSQAFGVGEIISGVEEAYAGAQNGSIYGIPWPWDCLTADTMGKKRGDLIIIYGRMKTMKTWVMLYSAVMDYMMYNQRVMIWSREMTPDKLKLRIGSILAGVDYQMLKAGKLPPGVEKRAFKTLKELSYQLNKTPEKLEKDSRKYVRDLIVLSGRDAPKGIASLDEHVDRYKPDILYVDSFYHLETEKVGAKAAPWYKIQSLTEDLKTLAMDRNIPVVAVTQANREGEKKYGEDMTDIAGSDSIGREADLALRVVKKRTKEEYRAEYEANPKQRKGEEEKPKKTKKLGLQLGKPVKKNIRTTPEPEEEDEIQKKAKDISRGKFNSSVGAEIAVILPGNREGVLEGFVLHAIPGYHFKVTQSSIDSEGVRQWLSSEGSRRRTSYSVPNKAMDGAPPIMPTLPDSWKSQR